MHRSTRMNLYMTTISALCFASQTLVSADEGAGISTKTYKAETGPGGAKVSKTKTSVQGNADGSVSANRSHESHAVTAAGSAHHSSDATTTVSPDGSTASVKHEAKTTEP